MKFLFWNLNGQLRPNLVSELAHQYSVDVIVLCECLIEPVDLLEALNLPDTRRWSRLVSPSKYIEMYFRLPDGSVKLISDSARLSIREIRPPIGESLLLVVAHLSSKLYQRDEDQMFTCTRIARDIDEAEEKVSHSRTIVMGDLNMNPFESGLVAADGLHAVMDRKIAERVHRTVDGVSRKFFYNPMWGHLGDGTPGPSGTYYYNSATQVNYFWNIFDQVLVRPSLLPYFKNEDIKIITVSGSVSLLRSSGIPDGSVGSDHLPIVLNLDVERGV